MPEVAEFIQAHAEELLPVYFTMQRFHKKVIPGIDGSWKAPMQAVLLSSFLELFRVRLKLHERIWVAVRSKLGKISDIQHLNSVFLRGTQGTCRPPPYLEVYSEISGEREE